MNASIKCHASFVSKYAKILAEIALGNHSNGIVKVDGEKYFVASQDQYRNSMNFHRVKLEQLK